MTKPNHVPVAIVGGGPCGLALALQLAQRKIPCAVFEKKSGLSTHPKAMGISRRSSEILQQLGVFDALYEPCRHLAEAPGVCLTIFVKSFVGEEWGRIPLTDPVSPLSPGPSFHCPQTLTEKVLFDALEKTAPGCVRFSQDVSGVKPGETGVEFSVGGQKWTADWLVAADGAGGQIRHGLNIESDGPGDMGHFLNVFFRAPYGPRMSGRHSMLLNVLSEELIAFFVAVNGEELWLMHHFLQPGETAEMFPAEKLAALIRQGSGMPEVPVEVLSISPWVMSPKVSRKFRHGRVLFAGDSAARMSPAGGLGLNNGLQSTHNLAWKLAAVVQGQASAALLDTYDTERRGAALWVLEHTNKNAGEVFGIVQAAIKQDWNEVQKLIAENGRRGSRLGIDLGIEYSAGALVPDGTDPVARKDAVNDYFPNARPGSRAPYHQLESTKSTFDLLGKDFTLLCAEKAAGAVPGVSLHTLPEASGFAAAYGLEPGGCVLVRPDGYVGARWRRAPLEGEIAKTMTSILNPI